MLDMECPLLPHDLKNVAHHDHLDTHRLFCDSVAFVSIIHTLFPPTPSLWAAHIAPMSAYEQSTLTARITEIIAAAATALVISGIVPLAVWAFFRFNAKRAVGPLILWASLAVVFCYFMYVGSSAEFHQSPEAITTTAGRADFIRGIVDSCAERRRGNRQMPTPFMETEFYCRCFGEKLARL